MQKMGWLGAVRGHSRSSAMSPGFLHRLLLLFTFIVFVPVHVLLTLYLEYDLIIIIII